ncbi:MAG: RNA polymerase primary sigma factor [Verrucomicrobiales bacterium]|jgi:RNA polymerase primary sigma factor
MLVMKEISPILQTYLDEIGATPLLTREDEVKLAKRIQRGDAKARDRMIRANLRLVVKIANDYASCGLPISDLIAEGNTGLMKAVERFDPSFGAKFSTYAVWWIKQSIRRALSNQSRTVRLPTHIIEKLSKVRQAGLEIEEKTGRRPRGYELTEATGLDARQLRLIRDSGQPTTSLDAPNLEGDEGLDMHERLDDEDAANPFEALSEANLLGELGGLLAVLDARERDIIVSRFGLEGAPTETLEQVGLRHGITRERIRQLQNIALKKMRKALHHRETPLPTIMRN